jgi:tetratricopeptide (TPR) repeat protein
MKVSRLFLALMFLVGGFSFANAQMERGDRNLGPSSRGENVIYGDLIVTGEAPGAKGTTYEIVLYPKAGGSQPLAKQSVSANGRYRFINLLEGDYDIAVLVENNEITRVRVLLRAPIYKTDIREDINLEWKATNNGPPKAASVTAEDFYKREPANQKLFDKAGESTDKKKYEESIATLKELVAKDAKDFQAWSELGTAYLLSKNVSEAEKAYTQSTEIRPTFFLALLNLGRLRILEQKYEAAIPVLTKAVEVKPSSADANYYLGEAYLQVKKGSKAVTYLYEALKLDPVGRAEAHLRLAALYNAAGFKDKAAAEYVEFLKKKPDYPEKKKLEEYIAQNKK